MSSNTQFMLFTCFTYIDLGSFGGSIPTQVQARLHGSQPFALVLVPKASHIHANSTHNPKLTTPFILRLLVLHGPGGVRQGGMLHRPLLGESHAADFLAIPPKY